MRALGMAMVLVGCGSEGSFRFSDAEIATHDAINTYRAEQGLPDLELHPAVGEPSRAHSEAMAAGADFSHDGFDQRAEAVRGEITGVNAVGENIARNRGFDDPVGVAVRGWIESDGHRENMEGDWTFTGVGIAQTDEGEWFFTQIFAD